MVVKTNKQEEYMINAFMMIGLAWWTITLIAITGVLLVAVIVLFILGKRAEKSPSARTKSTKERLALTRRR